MRESSSPRRVGLLLGAAIALIGSAGCSKDAPEPVVTANASPAAITTVITPAPKVIVREVAKPTRGKRAKAPPRNAKPSNEVHFDKSVQWKSNPQSKAVFAVDDGLVWFVDPDSGWPYTIDRRGVVYTADASTGETYSLGSMADWEGDAPYFFEYWDAGEGGYEFEDYAAYEALYTNESVEQYAYDEAYEEVWEYEDYFESAEFAQRTIEIQAAEYEAAAIAEAEYEEAKADAEYADAKAAVGEGAGYADGAPVPDARGDGTGAHEPGLAADKADADDEMDVSDDQGDDLDDDADDAVDADGSGEEPEVEGDNDGGDDVGGEE